LLLFFLDCAPTFVVAEKNAANRRVGINSFIFEILIAKLVKIVVYIPLLYTIFQRRELTACLARSVIGFSGVEILMFKI